MPDFNNLSDEELMAIAGVNSPSKQSSTSSLHDLSDEELMNIAGINPKMSRGEAAFTTLTNPLGLGARAKSAIAAGVAKGFGGEATKDVPISELYNEQLGVEQQKLAQAKKEYPAQSFATQLAADIGPAGKILKGIGLTSPTVGNTAKGAAALTGISTLGETQDLTNIPQVAKELAVTVPVGAAIGAAAHTILPAIGSIPRKIADRLFKTDAERIAEKAIPPEAAQEGLNILNQAPKEAPTVALDIDTPEFQGLLKNAVGKSPQAKRIAADFANGRKEQALNRVGQALSKDISPVDNAFKSIDDLVKERGELSKPLYEKAYSENISTPTTIDSVVRKGTLKEIINDDRVSSAIKTARKDYGISNEAEDVSIPVLHGARQVIDDIITTAKNAGENNKARSYTELRNKINTAMYEASPTLKQADEIFAGKSKLINATNEGIGFSKVPYQELSKKMQGFSQGEKEAYRIGARQAIMDTAEKATKATGKSAPAEAIINKQYDRKQINALFDGDSEKASQFVKKLDEEIRYDQTIKNLGLNKAEVEGTNHGLVNMLARVAAGSKTGMVYEGAKAAEIAMLKQYKGLNKNNAQALIKAFTNKEQGRKILENIAKKANGDQKEIINNAIRNLSPVLATESVPELQKQNTQ